MKKVKINKLPKGYHRMPDGTIMRDSDHQKMQAGGQPVLTGTSREAANLEAEKGETVVTDLDTNGIPEHYMIGGKKHSQGGTPLNLPAKSFIFSDHKSMSIKGDTLKKFIPGTKKKSMTPAEISKLKKFDMSEENEILKDSNADKMLKATAERNLQLKLVKLGELAMEQESIKDFEGGIPEIALPYLSRNGVTPEQVEMINGELEQKAMMEDMLAAYGKEVYSKGGMTKYQTKGETNESYAPDTNTAFNSLGIRFNLPQATSYSDVQAYDSDGRYGSAKDNLEGFFNEFEGVYKNLDALKSSLDKYGPGKSNPEVKKFQEWYTNTHIPERAEMIKNRVKKVRNYEMSDTEYQNLVKGLKDEFGFGTGKKGFDYDGLMGTVTSGRRVLDFEIDPLKEAAPETAPEAIVAEEFKPSVPENKDTPFYAQDMVKLGAKGMDRANRYFGYTQRVQPVFPDPVFLDPERELQANQEMGATNAQALALQGRGQNLAANLSLMQGKLAANQANTLARYNNANAQIADKFELAKADVINKTAQFNSLQNRQQAMDTATVNQQYDNFQRQKRNDLANLYANALTNRAETDLINDLFPQYSIDPSTGGMGEWTGVPVNITDDNQALNAFVNNYLQTVSGGPKTLEETGSSKKKTGGNAVTFGDLRKFIKR
jgi:hypothetical protein